MPSIPVSLLMERNIRDFLSPTHAAIDFRAEVPEFVPLGDDFDQDRA
jgi:hypothetical protein